ncbi:MAG: ABC transporter ATP-binding protein [Hyphomicrobiales bacterium]|nr:MAG: ABC transporter ATP-binding protein [Hyphomicrobiales bacterium]
MTAPLLRVEKLVKRFGALVVTDELSLDVRAGEMHAVIGPNGAGKTTFIHQLSGSLSSQAGRILFDDADITHLDMPQRVRRGLARSFQITSILPGQTVLANVALAVQARSGTSFRFLRAVDHEAPLNDAAAAILDRVGLGARKGVRAGSLSHGEKRLLEIAIAIATAPRLLLLDEPLAGLGQEEAQVCIQLLAALKREFSIILVEHDMDAVFQLADRISVLVAGRVIATGTPDEIRANAAVRQAYLGDGELD